MRAALAVVAAAALALPACTNAGTFCDTVRAINDSSAEIDVSFRGGGADARERLANFAAAARGAADRQLELLGTLERTAPDDVAADVRLVAELGSAFARAVRDGDVGAVTGTYLTDRQRTQAALAAYARVRGVTAARCGEALGVAGVDAAADVPPVPPAP